MDEVRKESSKTKLYPCKYDIKLYTGQRVIIVFAHKKLGYKKDIVLLGEVERITITKFGTVNYDLLLIKCLKGNEDLRRYVKYLWCTNEEVNCINRTKFRGSSFAYPVFTNKELYYKWEKMILKT